MDESTRNDVGRVFAQEAGVRELWLDAGPSEELRALVAGDQLSTKSRVLLGVALDFYDGTKHVALADALEQLQARENVDALFFLAEFIGSALTDLPTSLEVWTSQYLEEIAPSQTH